MKTNRRYLFMLHVSLMPLAHFKACCNLQFLLQIQKGQHEDRFTCGCDCRNGSYGHPWLAKPGCIHWDAASGRPDAWAAGDQLWAARR